MTVAEKILKCIEYCEQQHDTSNGEILEEMTTEDFKYMKTVITTLLEE